MKKVIAGIGSTLLLSLIIVSAVLSNKENKVVYQGYGDTYHLLFNNSTNKTYGDDDGAFSVSTSSGSNLTFYQQDISSGEDMWASITTGGVIYNTESFPLKGLLSITYNGDASLTIDARYDYSGGNSITGYPLSSGTPYDFNDIRPNYINIVCVSSGDILSLDFTYDCSSYGDNSDSLETFEDSGDICLKPKDGVIIEGVIEIPNDVTRIYADDFAFCDQLTGFTGGDNVHIMTYDGIVYYYYDNMWQLGCCPKGKTGSFTLYSGAKVIDGYSFIECDIDVLTIPDTYTWVVAGAFDGSTINEIHFMGSETEWNSAAETGWDDNATIGEVIFDA